MQVVAHRPEFAADFLEESADLIADGSAARGGHFGDEKASEDAIFFRDMAATGEAGAFFAAESDFILANVLADVLEADRSLQRGLAVGFCGGVEELRSGDAAGGGQLPAASLDEVVVDEGENVVRLNPGAVA